MFALLFTLLSLLPSDTTATSTGPWPLQESGWRTDVAWYDGRAEKCVYEATRTIYGLERRYVGTAYTNKQNMDALTTTKASSDGVEVFKHHWSERIETPAYDYDFSTATFTRAGDLAAFKLTVSTQEDCGASFKQAWRDGERFAWLESVYFPNAGLAQGELLARDLHFEDELSLLLRDFPFEAKGFERVELTLVSSQKDTHSVPFQPQPHTIVRGERTTLALPVGQVEAYPLELHTSAGERRATYWFAADGRVPWLHALVQYEGPTGINYRLRSIERTAYWER